MLITVGGIKRSIKRIAFGGLVRAKRIKGRARVRKIMPAIKKIVMIVSVRGFIFVFLVLRQEYLWQKQGRQ